MVVLKINENWQKAISFSDIPWNDLDTDIPPSLILSITTADDEIISCVEDGRRFSWFGMEVLLPNSQGKYPPVDWGLHRGMERNRFLWHRLLSEHTGALLFLPMQLISRLMDHVIVAWIEKFQTSFCVKALFHPHTAKNTPPVKVCFHIELNLTLQGGSTLYICVEEIALIKNWDERIDPVMFIGPLPWSQLHPAIPPIANFSVSSPSSDADDVWKIRQLSNL
jgi:hypothetical protein